MSLHVYLYLIFFFCITKRVLQKLNKIFNQLKISKLYESEKCTLKVIFEVSPIPDYFIFKVCHCNENIKMKRVNCAVIVKNVQKVTYLSYPPFRILLMFV